MEPWPPATLMWQQVMGGGGGATSQVLLAPCSTVDGTEAHGGMMA